MPGNAAASIGLSILAGQTGLRLDPHPSSHFVVEIEGVLAGGFSQVSGLEVEIETLEYREGGHNEFVHRFAGPVRNPLLTLRHGLSPIDGLWEWHQEVMAGVINRHNGTIFLLNPRQEPVMWWNFERALLVKWTGPSLDAQSAGVAFETVELSHYGLSRPELASVAGIAGELTARIPKLGGFF